MQITIFALGMAALAAAAPNPIPLPTPAAVLPQRRQYGGELSSAVPGGPSGFVSGTVAEGSSVAGEASGGVPGGPSGFVSGVVGVSTLAGCIGGGLPNGLGETICFPFAAKATTLSKAAKISKRAELSGAVPGGPSGFVSGTVATGSSVAGEASGGVPDGPSGFVSGVVGKSTLAGCIGGGLPNGLGETICFPFAAKATAKPKPRNLRRQEGGELSSAVPNGPSGFVSGTVASGTSTVAGVASGGVPSGPSGFVSGIAGSSTLAGCIGGGLPDGLGATLCYPFAAQATA